MIQKYVLEDIKLLGFVHFCLEGFNAIEHRCFFGEVAKDINHRVNRFNHIGVVTNRSILLTKLSQALHKA